MKTTVKKSKKPAARRTKKVATVPAARMGGKVPRPEVVAAAAAADPMSVHEASDGLSRAVAAEKITVRRTRTHVSFFRAGETEPFSRLHNGAPGSDAHAKAQEAISEFATAGHAVEIVDAEKL